MARQLTRSISTVQPDMADKNIALRRNISYNGTSSFGSQILTTGNIAGDTSQIKDCLLDGQAQVGEFIKEYVSVSKMGEHLFKIILLSVLFCIVTPDLLRQLKSPCIFY
jgi:hypothetical protein